MATLTDTQRAAGWKKYVLSDIVEIIGGGTPKTSIPEYWNGDIPWLSVTDFSGDSRYVYDTEKKITQDGLENSSTKLLLKDDIIISARGTVGELAQLSSPMAFNQSCFGIRAIPDKLNQSYLYYLLRTVIEELRQNSHGSIFSTITRKTFDTVEVIIPPHEEQENIAGILGSLDDKIEANNRIIQTINNLGDHLTKKYIESASEVRKLFEIADVTMGQSPAGNYINIDGKGIPFFQGKKDFGYRYPVNRTYTDKPTRIARSGDILFSVRAPVGSMNLVMEECCIGRGLSSIHSSVNQRALLFYILKNSPYIWEVFEGEGTIFSSINKKDLSNLAIPYSNGENSKSIGDVLEIIEIYIFSLACQNISLAELREELIEKLIVKR